MYVQKASIFRDAAQKKQYISSMEIQRNEEQEQTDKKMREIPQLKIGDYVLMPEFDDGGEYFQEKAKNELRETDEVVQQAFMDIRVLVQGEPDLILPDDDEFFQKFLRPCKWYPKSAFELMKRFYKFRLNNPRYSKNLLPSNEKKALSAEIAYPLPERSKDGSRLLLINAGKKWNPKVVSLDEIFRITMLALDAAMAEPKTQIAGVHVILNMEGFSLSQVTYFTPSFAAAVAEWVQKCLPCRLKGIHIMNQPFIFNMVFAIFKPFLMEKTRKRILFHGTDKNALISHLGKKAVPTTLGGDLVLPETSIGNGICDYFCWFDNEFEISNRYGYVKNAK